MGIGKKSESEELNRANEMLKQVFQSLLKITKEDENPVYQTILGLCYENGDGTDENKKFAFKCYKKAAEQEFAWAEYKMGDCYYYGHGVEKDETKAYQWYKKSADRDFAPAIPRLDA